MKNVTIAMTAFAAMEPVAAAAHRAVMHGFGWSWHRSHHRPPKGRLERNDLFPLCFAAGTTAVMAGASRAGRRAIVAAGVGVTAYGAAYAAVHDVCVHGRLSGGRPLIGGRYLRRVAGAHAVHHRFGEAPYGFLVPIVPARHRAATQTLRPVATRARAEKTSYPAASMRSRIPA